MLCAPVLPKCKGAYGSSKTLQNTQPTKEHARQLITKLKLLDNDFKIYHFEVVDAVADDDAETLSQEQDILDENDDIVADLSIRLKRLDSPETQSQDTQDPKKLLSRQLTHMEKSLSALHDAITTIPTSHEDISIIEQYDSKLADYRTEILQNRTALLSIEGEMESLLSFNNRLESLLFECSPTHAKS